MAIVQSGTFTGAATATTLVLRSDVDYLEVINETEMAATTTAHGFKYYWRRGMAQGAGLLEKHVTVVDTGGANQPGFVMTGACAANAGFFLIDNSDKTPGALVAVTAGTNVTQPVYSTANTGTVLAGSIVRIIGSDHTNLAGLDFSVDAVTANTEFRLANAIATAPGVVAGAAGSYRMVAQDLTTYKAFYPATRYIANITAANPAVVTTLVDHGYTVGDKVRINVPAECGMTQMNGLLANITVVSAGTFTTDIDASAFTAFKFPLPAVGAFTPAQVVPVGIKADQTGALTDQLRSGLFIGIKLMPGVLSPGGSASDVISWKAYKSDNL